MLTKCLFSIQTWVCIYWWTRKKPFDRWYDQKMQVQYVMLKQGILLSWVRIMLLRIKWIFCEFQPKAQILSFNTRVRTIDSMMINAAAGHLWSLLLIEDLIKLYFAEMDGITWDVIPQPQLKAFSHIHEVKDNFEKFERKFLKIVILCLKNDKKCR